MTAAACMTASGSDLGKSLRSADCLHYVDKSGPRSEDSLSFEDATFPREMVSLLALFTDLVCMPSFVATVCTEISQPILTTTNHTIYDLILSGSLAGPFFLITALLPHMFVISLVTFTKILAHIVVKTFRADL